ncbi:LysM peptidoglycan-binding domain-containing protein [Priestia megaterium]|nr:LysM peptidoglycan-binding domain-containing protein [Priestia megaterium]
MKKSYIKSLVVMSAAVFAFIGLQSSTAVAQTQYQVVKGDTLWQLGKQYGVTIDDIKQENNRVDDWIYIGETLRIPERTKVLGEQSIEAEPIQEEAEQAVSISEEEKDLFARLVEAEAKGESYEGKVAVATVVLNRVDSAEFPDTVTGVIKEVVGNSYAFSPVQNGEINKPASEEAEQAVEEALMRADHLSDCIYFYNPDIATDDWIRSREVVATIGNHVFAK